MSGSIVDEDTARTINDGRETLGEFLIAIRNEFRKVFLVFAVAMVGTIGAMQYYVWEILRGVTEARMTQETSSQYDILVRTPFDVILLQVKIGMVVGVVLALPVLLYYSKDGLERRDLWPDLPFSRTALAGIALLSLALFLAGGAYAYFVFFPVMFNFLTNYTLNVGFAPSYDVVKWTQFILLLTASFGFAGQLPLVMSGLSYLEIVPYETFRDKWRYAVMGIFLFGAVFSPPDPFTQIMWAIPLLVLYGISLYFSKFVTAIKRDETAGIRRNLRENWNRLAGTLVLSSGAVYYLVQQGYVARLNDLLARAPAGYRYEVVLEGLPLAGDQLALAIGVAAGVVVTFPLLVYYAWPELEPRGIAALDVDEMTAEAVHAAPTALFAEMDEEEALGHAQRAMDDDQPEKARIILDRHDAVQDDEEEEEEEEGAEDAEDAEEDPDRPDNMAEDLGPSGPASAGEFAQERTAGVLNAFTEDETTEDDIGGYYDDIMFIISALTSRMFRIVGVFMAVVAVTFIALYRGGIGLLKDDFLSRIPPAVIPEGGVDIVALHPVEAILFEVKMSVIAGAVAVLPVVVYYAWPAVEQRFHGITREYETGPPLSAVAAHWNQVAGAAVLGAGGAYYAIAQGLLTVPPVAAFGVGASATQVGYAVVALSGLVPATVAGGYHAGASVRERLQYGGKQNVFLVWMVTLAGGLVVGSVLGYAYFAPAIISYLVEDAIRADMIIAYRINNFFWLIFATTIGIGLLADVPLTMWLFHRGGIVGFATMRDRWREVVVAIFAVSAMATPESMLSMFLMAAPVSVAYLVGLGGLWAWTLPRRTVERVKELA